MALTRGKRIKVYSSKRKHTAVNLKAWNRCKKFVFGPKAAARVKQIGRFAIHRCTATNQCAVHSSAITPKTPEVDLRTRLNEVKDIRKEVLQSLLSSPLVKNRCTEQPTPPEPRRIQYYNLYKTEDPDSWSYKSKWITVIGLCQPWCPIEVNQVLAAVVMWMSAYRPNVTFNHGMRRKFTVGQPWCPIEVNQVLAAVVMWMSAYRPNVTFNHGMRRKFTVADESGAISCYVSGNADLKFRVGDAVLIHKFKVLNNEIITTRDTRITRRQKMKLSDSATTVGAAQYLRPTAPYTTIDKIVTPSLSVKISLKAVATQVGPLQTNTRRTDQRFIRVNVVLRDATGTINLMLRNSAALFSNIEVGDTVSVLGGRCMWNAQSNSVTLVVIYEDQIVAVPPTPRTEEIVLLRFQETDEFNTLRVTVQRLTGVEHLRIYQTDICEALASYEEELFGPFHRDNIDLSTIHAYGSIQGTGFILHGFVTRFEVFRRRHTFDP